MFGVCEEEGSAPSVSFDGWWCSARSKEKSMKLSECFFVYQMPVKMIHKLVCVLPVRYKVCCVSKSRKFDTQTGVFLKNHGFWCDGF